jgi:trimethylamine:corrinoid methyltransferase-like protein
MKRANAFEYELDEIRVKLYEETKNMTAEEHVAYIHALAAPVLKEFGLRTLNQIKSDEQMKKEAIAS